MALAFGTDITGRFKYARLRDYEQKLWQQQMNLKVFLDLIRM